MVPNGSKSAIFLDDGMSYPGNFRYSNQARRMNLKKYYLEKDWFIGFWCLDREIFDDI